MFTIIIGNGLTNGNLSSQQRFLNDESTVGQYEIDRLMGEGRFFGAGPLPTFLAEAEKAASTGSPVGVIILRPDDDDEAHQLVDCIKSSVIGARMLPTVGGILPWQSLFTSVKEMTAVDLMSMDAPRENVRFLVVGSHTEREAATVATALCSIFGCTDVAVSPHLTGSSTREAHYAVLRHNLRQVGVKVLLDLEEASAYAGVAPDKFTEFDCHRCVIEPANVRDLIGDTERRIIELLCMHLSRVRLRPLAGGFSGSLLFLADGWKGDARTEPMVLKIDSYAQMRREIGGYHRVKDFLGKHVPTFGYPVSLNGFLGIAMELAAMEGRPGTLQDAFEEAENDQAAESFLRQLEKALGLLSEKLYRNTAIRSAVVPYRAFGLHIEQQLEWLRGNTEVIKGYLKEAGHDTLALDAERLRRMVRVIAANPDSIESESCLSHGDLNFANAICDAGDNIWFIDWTHSDVTPIELDFAKLENDVKFVMSKAFDLDDLPRLRTFEEYLLASRIPADIEALPDSLKFVKWDLRFRKILTAVRAVRSSCFVLKDSKDWLIYRVALLRYAMHTLSFDKRSGRGECELPQLTHALYSVESLVLDLMADDFHLKIRSEKPESYPMRQRISIDEAPWFQDSDSYNPPYFVDSSVLEHDRSKVEGGWADPEDFGLVPAENGQPESKYKDEQGRALNPRGRTGIAGRGLLGRWGSNLAVASVLVRSQRHTRSCEILVGRRPEQTGLELPEGFVLSGEKSQDAIVRVVRKDTGWEPRTRGFGVVFEGYTYDPRQTDHAWVESRAYLIVEKETDTPDTFNSSGNYEEVKWMPLNSDTVNRFPARQAQFVRDAVRQMIVEDVLAADQAELMLAKTG